MGQAWVTCSSPELGNGVLFPPKSYELKIRVCWGGQGTGSEGSSPKNKGAVFRRKENIRQQAQTQGSTYESHLPYFWRLGVCVSLAGEKVAFTSFLWGPTFSHITENPSVNFSSHVTQSVHLQVPAP